MFKYLEKTLTIIPLNTGHVDAVLHSRETTRNYVDQD